MRLWQLRFRTRLINNIMNENMLPLYDKTFARLLIISLYVCSSFFLEAQELVLKSLIETTEILSTDKQRNDANDVPCAVLRFILPKDKASFEGNVVGTSVYKNGEYWVYVSSGTKRIRVKYNNLKPFMLDSKNFSIPFFKSKTIYEIVFDRDQLHKIEYNESQSAAKQMDKIIIKGYEDWPGQRVKLYLDGKYSGELLSGHAHWKTIEGEVGKKCKVTVKYENKYGGKRTRKITVKFGEHHYIETQSTVINAY